MQNEQVSLLLRVRASVCVGCGPLPVHERIPKAAHEMLQGREAKYLLPIARPTRGLVDNETGVFGMLQIPQTVLPTGTTSHPDGNIMGMGWYRALS